MLLHNIIAYLASSRPNCQLPIITKIQIESSIFSHISTLNVKFRQIRPYYDDSSYVYDSPLSVLNSSYF